MLKDNIFRDVFGQHYLIDNGVSLVDDEITEIYFSDSLSAERFLRSLELSSSDTRALSAKVSDGASPVSGEQSLPLCLLSGKLRVVALGDTALLEKAKASPVLKSKSGLAVKITPKSFNLLEDKEQRQAYSSKQAVEKLLDELQISHSQLEAMAESFDVDTKSNQDLRSICVNAIVSGKLSVHKVKTSLPKPKESGDDVLDVPGSRPVEAPPSEQPMTTAQQPTKNDKEGDQAEALNQAAEEEAAFCEDCEASAA